LTTGTLGTDGTVGVGGTLTAGTFGTDGTVGVGGTLTAGTFGTDGSVTKPVGTGKDAEARIGASESARPFAWAGATPRATNANATPVLNCVVAEAIKAPPTFVHAPRRFYYPAKADSMRGDCRGPLAHGPGWAKTKPSSAGRGLATRPNGRALMSPARNDSALGSRPIAVVSTGAAALGLTLPDGDSAAIDGSYSGRGDAFGCGGRGKGASR
jgi:hypothetical protein